MACIICLEVDPVKRMWHLHLYIFFKNFFIDQESLQNTQMFSLWTLLDELKRGFTAVLFTNKVSYHDFTSQLRVSSPQL